MLKTLFLAQAQGLVVAAKALVLASCIGYFAVGVISIQAADSTGTSSDETHSSLQTKPSNLKGSATARNATARNATARNAASAELARSEMFVRDALFHEISGDTASRKKLLENARAIAPDSPSANWHSGNVLDSNDWVPVDEYVANKQKDSRLQAYLKQRSRSSDNVMGNLRLAAWSLDRRLNEQARAHFNRVLEFDPNNQTARAALGYRRFAGAWFTPAEIERRLSAQTYYIKQLNDWMPKVTPIVDGVRGNDEKLRTAALEELSQLKDVESIPALEYAFSFAGTQWMPSFIEKLANWDHPAATEALLRQSVYWPDELVRRLAAEKLGTRSREDYIPQLLNALRTPVERFVWVGLPVNQNGNWNPRFGNLAYRQVFVHEGREGWEIQQFESVYFASKKNGKFNANLQEVGLDARRRQAIDEATLAIQNWKTQQLNERLLSCLANSTGKTVLVNPDDWWNWWDQENETMLAGEKTTRTLNLARDIVVGGDGYQPMTEYVSDWYVPVQRHSCFVAGTTVTAISGGVPIESVKTGDLVLSQSSDTGELTFKPVLRTTVRQGATVFTIETSGTTLHATGGHLFWVAGEGWTKARNLRSGQTLHCANGTVQVSLVTEEPQPQQTYNLVVADFNTYFVGAERMLTHDVTERKPTRSIVPGLARN